MRTDLDETVVQYLVLKALGKAPDIAGTALQPRVTWAMLGPCAERTEAERILAELASVKKDGHAETT